MTSTTSTGRNGVAESWVPSHKPKPKQRRGFLPRKPLKGCLRNSQINTRAKDKGEVSSRAEDVKAWLSIW